MSSDKNDASEILGHIDSFDAGVIRGWVIDKSEPANRPVVFARSANRVLAETIADGFREDLFNLGLGDGRHAFELLIPDDRRISSQIEIIHKPTGRALAGSPLSLLQYDNETSDQEDAPLFLIDFSPILNSDDEGDVSKINFLCTLASLSFSEPHRLRPIYYSAGEKQFFQFPLDEIRSVVSNIPISNRHLALTVVRRSLLLRNGIRSEPFALKSSEIERALILSIDSTHAPNDYIIRIREWRRQGARFVVVVSDLPAPQTSVSTDLNGYTDILRMKIARNADRIITTSTALHRRALAYYNSLNLPLPQISLIAYHEQRDVLGERFFGEDERAVNTLRSSDQVEHCVSEATSRRTRNAEVHTEIWAAFLNDFAEHSQAAVSTFASPILPPGEYCFGHVDSLEGGSISSEIVSEPQLTHQRLTAESYILAEEALGNGDWYAPESWGRWGHKDRSTLSFRLQDPAKRYFAVLLVRVAPSLLPSLLIISSPETEKSDEHKIASETSSIRIDLGNYARDEMVRLKFLIKNCGGHKPGDEIHRIGFARMAILDADSVPQRLEILERDIFG